MLAEKKLADVQSMLNQACTFFLPSKSLQAKRLMRQTATRRKDVL